MSAAELLRAATRGLLANRLRSSLTMLGILIGVAAVIILLAVGNGSAIAVQKRIEALGTNTLTVFPSRGFGFFGGGAGGGGRSRNGTQSRAATLTAKDVKALEDRTQAPDLKSVSPVVNASVTGAYNGATYQPSQFVGTTPSYFEASNWSIASGRFFTDADEKEHARVVVLGQTVVENLFGAQDPLGATVQFGSASFQVVGVLATKGTNGPQDEDDVAIAPLSAVQDTLTGLTGGYSTLIVQARSSHVMDEAEAEVTSILDTTHGVTAGNEDFRVLNQGSLLQASSSTTHTFTVLLGAVAAISLLVGGIGVMNIMLVTVTERTREIGIRKAIGARRGDILGQFLVEAVMLCLAGGLAGVAAGIGGSRFRIVGVQPVIQLWSIALAFGVAVAVGLFFGIYPANRAAALRPIDALRYE